MNVSRVLRDWYAGNKRDLPWRHTNDPYIIWLSEIILQQTRVNQGLPYFYKFTEAFPDVHSLAAAPTDKVLKLWQGLGYYSRARNLHSAAKQVVTDFGGKFPESKAQLMTLKGVGDYTAAAVASFSSGEPVAVLDGNVFRFLSRFYGIDTPINAPEAKKVFGAAAEELVPAKDAAMHNQAIMEFGALQCKPASPDCSVCPLKTSCFAFKHHKTAELPVKIRKSAVRSRYFYYLVIRSRSDVLISKRTAKDIWKDLYEFPLIESSAEIPVPKLLRQKSFAELTGNAATVKSVSDVFVHKLSHQTIFARFVELRVKELQIKGYEKIPWKKIHDFPVSRLTEKYLEISGG